MTAIRSSLARHLPSDGPTDYDISAERVRAYREKRFACLHLDEITDPWERQTVKNIADRIILGGRNGR